MIQRLSRLKLLHSTSYREMVNFSINQLARFSTVTGTPGSGKGGVYFGMLDSYGVIVDVEDEIP